MPHEARDTSSEMEEKEWLEMHGRVVVQALMPPRVSPE